MENKRNHEDIRFVYEWDGRYGAGAMLSNPAFKRYTVFSDSMISVHMRQLEIYIDKPIYVGLTVLDLSKIKVYGFHYDFMKKRLGDQCKVLYMDTDSLIYEIKNVNIYDEIRENPKEFDTSNYPVDNPFGIVKYNKKVVGVMKDECAGRIINEFNGIRAKLYLIIHQRIHQASITDEETMEIDEEAIMRGKGIKRHLLQNGRIIEYHSDSLITPDDFRKCLFEKRFKSVVQCNIRSKGHDVKTEQVEKVALSPYDEKRYLIPGHTDTYPWGHYLAPNEQDFDELEEEDNEVLGMLLPMNKQTSSVHHPHSS